MPLNTTSGRWRLRRRSVLVWVALVTVALGRDIQVDGAGWWRDRELARTLAELGGAEPTDVITANAVEDAVFFVLSALVADGYLDPVVVAEIFREGGERIEHRFDKGFTALLPRPLRGVSVLLRVERGQRYRFGAVTVTGGGDTLAEERAAELLRAAAGADGWGQPVFSPDRLGAGVARLEVELRSAGFAEAQATVESERRDTGTGEVAVDVRVQPGPRWRLEAVRVAGGAQEVKVPDGSAVVEWWTASAEQDVIERLRRAYFEAGYPDVVIVAQRSAGEPVAGQRPVVVELTVESGPPVRTAAVQFTGDDVLRTETLRRRTGLTPGAPLNPLVLEEARRRLERLGALTRVRLSYEPEQGEVRAPVFALTAREPWETSLLLGYGSFDHLRAGVEVRGFNLLRRSHQVRAEAVASLRSRRGEGTYTVPEIFGEQVDGRLRLFGLERDERAFRRSEYGITLALSRRDIPWLGAEGEIGYTFQNLVNDGSDLATRETDLGTATTASFTLGLNRDRRDNPLMPREGHRWYGQLEVADPILGGEVGFQHLEIGAAWHQAWGDASWVHVGLSHGTVLTLGRENDLDLPVNRRFYPGGESSYRGLREGAAAPIAADGRSIGAKSMTLLNVEWERALGRRLSAVLFWDSLMATARLEDFPGEVWLNAVGLGLRYRTPIGPLRVEYGYNLERRPGDGRGALHVTLGFPF